jgi:hypothetical protein
MLGLILSVGIALAADSAPQAPSAASLFDEGITFQEFLSGVQAQRRTWEENSARPDPPAALVDRLKRAGTGLKLLAISEAACSDSVQTVPYIARLASLAGIELRIVTKARGLPLLERHRTPDGRTATPTIVLLREGKDAGAWVERPEVLQAWFIAHGELSSRERVARKTSWYDWDRGASTLAELVALVERATATDGPN